MDKISYEEICVLAIECGFRQSHMQAFVNKGLRDQFVTCVNQHISTGIIIGDAILFAGVELLNWPIGG